MNNSQRDQTEVETATDVAISEQRRSRKNPQCEEVGQRAALDRLWLPGEPPDGVARPWR